MNTTVKRFGLLILIMVISLKIEAAIPHLEVHGSAVQLVVKDKPVLLLAGELGNSSASSASYMAPHWARLQRMHLNTVLAPVSWELVEPEEDHFDWQSLDSIIKAARAHDLKLVLLWFGAWKNSMSTYAPSWVKRDESRFPRAQLPDGRGEDILSAFSPALRDADAHAFAALMMHLKQVDQNDNTVLMIQVENEMGMLPVARDYSEAATQRFNDSVPPLLIHKLDALSAGSRLRELWQAHGAKQQGSWPALFGDDDAGAEVFTAWYYASYAESVAAAGKAVYPLPMYVNAALNHTGKAPGEYPSGGPLPHLLEVWKTAAPSIDLLAPDIYFPNFVDLATVYKRKDNALFIPEANHVGNPQIPANAFYAFGKLDAIGFGPFSVESIDDSQPNALADAYAVLEQLSPAILANQGMQRMSGFKPRVLENGTVIDTPVTETIGAYTFTVSFVDNQSPKDQQDTASHGGIIIQTGAEDYLVAGQGMIVTFSPGDATQGSAGIDYAWEGAFDTHGHWMNGRRLNGDQTHQGRHLRLAPGKFQIQKIRLYYYH